MLSRLGIELSQPSFDSRLAKYLLSTVDNNEIVTIAGLYGKTKLAEDEAVYGKGAKRALPEKAIYWAI